MRIATTKHIKQIIKQNRFLYVLLFPLILLRRSILGRKARAFQESYNSIFGQVEGGTLVVRVPDFQGIFEMDWRSDILKRLLRDKQYEEELVAIVRKYIDPQKDALDIGANIGLFAVLFSKLLAPHCRVLAVEPTPMALHHLHRNIERNGCSRSVIVFEGVLAAVKGGATINTIAGMEEYSSLGSIVHPSAKDRPHNTIEIKGDTMDNLVSELNLNPGFIKIDTEGAEHMVLTGAVDTLRKSKPVILSELSDTLMSTSGHTSEEVVRVIQSNGYHIVNALAPHVRIRFPFDGEILALPR